MSPSTPSRKATIPFQPNPFTNVATGSPWIDSPADVTSINYEAFQLLRNGLRQALLGSDPISIVVTGEPGSGKTHLLSRLKRYLEALPDGEKTWYVYVRCNASAHTLWRHLQGCLAGDLLHAEQDGHTRLDELVRKDPRRLDQVKHLGVHRALESLASGRHTLAASAWLRGEALPDADLEALGIGIEKDDEDRSREMEAKLVVEALLRFLSPTTVVICFDQVEALETYPGEEAGYYGLGQMVSDLVNEQRHVLLISCIVAAFEHKLEKLANGAIRDRWLQEKATLKPIEWEPAQELIKTRLDNAPVLAALRARHLADPLWPLDATPLCALFAQTGRCLPRKLIQACKVEFARQMGDADPRPQISREDFLQQEYNRLLTQARSEWRKAGGEKVLADTLPWLLESSGMTVLGRQPDRSSYANLEFRTGVHEVALMFCYAPGVSFTNRLRKAIRNWNEKPELKILSDPSIQPKPGSRGAQYLDQLKEQGARQIHPLPEALAALQAIRNLTATARAGELSQDGETVDEAAATKWALANLQPQLEVLRDELRIKPLVDPLPETATKTRLLALLSQHRVMEADAAGRELSLSTEEVASCARRYPMHFGILEGPPLVLFEAVEGSEAETAHA